MKSVAVFIVCWTTSTLSSFWQFQKLVKHITGHNAFFFYYGYGRYCGLGGRGIPVDATDRCCWAQDCCYHKLKEYGCQPILSSYPFSIVNGTVACGCIMGGSCLCGQKACECDKQCVYCFKDNLGTYNKPFRQTSSADPHAASTNSGAREATVPLSQAPSGKLSLTSATTAIGQPPGVCSSALMTGSLSPLSTGIGACQQDAWATVTPPSSGSPSAVSVP